MNIGLGLVIAYGLYGVALAVQSALRKPDIDMAQVAKAASEGVIGVGVVAPSPWLSPRTEAPQEKPAEVDVAKLADMTGVFGVGILGGGPHPTKTDPALGRKKQHR